jgi:PKD repeat protein
MNMKKIAFILCAIIGCPIYLHAQEIKYLMTDTDTTAFDVQPDSIEFEILKTFYRETRGKRWKNNSNWMKGKTSADFATWYGITVEGGDVSEIRLDENNLQGEVPENIFDLVRLTVLSLSGNRLKEDKEKKVLTLESLSSKSHESFSTLSTLQLPVRGGKNLPFWGLAVQGDNLTDKAQKIDWRKASPPVPEVLTNSDPSKIGSTSVAIDGCGRLAFYVLHSGVDQAYQLNLFGPDGTKLTDNVSGSLKQALNAAAGNTEIQVVRVPGFLDEWYIIYSLYQGHCLSNPPGSVYCPARVVYARVKYTGGVLTIQRDKRQISVSSNTFTQGKAVSRTVNGDPNRHYLYLWERTINSQTSRIHRYIIDQTGINFGSKSGAAFNAGYWLGGIAGSSVELSPDEQLLAISNRNVGSWIKEDVIIFDLRKFADGTYQPKLISVPELKLYGAGSTIKQLYSTDPKFYCYRFLKNKLSAIEFSPSGRYLYMLHGGYPDNTGGIAYNTYLLQIDLQSSSGSDMEVRLQVEQGNGVTSSSCYGSRALVTSPLLGQIQTAFDGKLYFTKGYRRQLYVIPHPDDPMPQDLNPRDVSLAETSSPNIQMYNNTRVYFMPENIDGYDYLTKATIDLFTLSPPDNVPKDQTVTMTIPTFSASTTYQISWGDGTVEITSSSTKTHVFTQKGNYEVILTATDNNGCASYSVKGINVIDCVAALGMQISTNQILCATQFSVPKLSDCFATYLWTFGDGTTSRARMPLKVYASSGTYNVSVKISYNCVSCRGDFTITKTIQVVKAGPTYEEVTLTIPSDIRPNIITSGCTTFANNWGLDHNEPALENLDAYTSGAVGVWRGEGSFAYNENRKVSAPINLKEDGTYSLEYFVWPHANLDLTPKWIKANSITRYNSSSYETENKDALGIYSAALYDYKGQLQAAQGVNMSNQEMGFTSFEGPTGLAGSDHIFTKPTGNLIFSTKAVPAYTSYKINSGKSYVAVVEIPIEKLAGIDKVDIVTNAFSGISILRADLNVMRDVKILCKDQHTNPNWTVIVFDREPLLGIWNGEIRIKNIISLADNGVIDTTFSHTGKSSLKITSTYQTFEQKLLKLEAGKSYHINAWVSTKPGVLTTPLLPGNPGIDVILKNSSGSELSTIYILPVGPIIDGWQQVRGSFVVPQSDVQLHLKFKGVASGIWYDDIRIHPETGNMKSYVYSTDDFRLRAILDEQNFASIFFYDKEGNLYLTKKETEEGIKTIAENITYLIER